MRISAIVAKVFIQDTASKELACFCFHAADQINFGLNLMIYITVSFVCVP